MNYITKQECEGLTPEEKCHVNALMSWNGQTFDEAKETIRKEKENIGNVTYANSSIQAAKEGIDKYQDNLKSDEMYDAVIKILCEIHDKWVEENAKKYNRDAEKADKRLYQHLPSELIGLDELSQDMKFLAPFLEEQGIEIGLMENSVYGNFVPSEQIATAYARRVEVYLDKHPGLRGQNKEDAMSEVVNEYKPLHCETNNLEQDVVANARVRYMHDRCALLVQQVEEKASNYRFVDLDNVK